MAVQEAAEAPQPAKYPTDRLLPQRGKNKRLEANVADSCLEGVASASTKGYAARTTPNRKPPTKTCFHQLKIRFHVSIAVSMRTPRYQQDRSYEWNYTHSPPWDEQQRQALHNLSAELAKHPAAATYAGLKVRRPVAVAAGPLLNGHWCLAYAAMGFEVVTYKTVRTCERACLPHPNLVPVSNRQIACLGKPISTDTVMRQSWAVSFGMPSRSPRDWQADIAWTRQELPSNFRLAVSVVGTTEKNAPLLELANDYARAAAWAASAGADIIEINLSCPNVCSADGQLFQSATKSRQVAEKVAERLDRERFRGPKLAKIGYLPDDEPLHNLADGLREILTGCVMNNSIPAQIQDPDGTQRFQGQQRGVCGEATRVLSMSQTRRFAANEANRTDGLITIGVGGIQSTADVDGYRQAGAESVQVATAAMVDDRISESLGLIRS